MSKTQKRATGDFFENVTAEWMKKNGYKILARNWVSSPYELDIIALKKGTLVFTEVKSGNKAYFESPESRINLKKMSFLVSAAKSYLYKLSVKGVDPDAVPVRFDAAAITFDDNKEIIEFKYYENYFTCEDFNR